ncbi:MAG: DUF5689 domain-containing protein [Saprospiraceae bacterium]
MKRFFPLIAAFILLNFSSCLERDFDSPPSNLVEVNEDQIITIDKLFESLQAGQVNTISDDFYINGVVVADDRSGNFYKTLIIEDLRGELGISVSIDENELHALYPVGQEVYIALSGLGIGYYNNLPTLGIKDGTNVARIPPALVKSILLRGKSGLEVLPRTVNVGDLSSDHLNTLIELDGFQFENPSTTYADQVNQTTVNQTIKNCTGSSLILRNSGFADFAGFPVQAGNGKITAVYSVYRSDAQLFIRDTTDLKFYGDRCGQGGSLISIKDLRNLYKGTALSMESGYVQGIVISDIANKNINDRNIVVQEGEDGILLRFQSAINIPLGSEVKVNLAGGSLEEFRTLLQVQNLTNSNVEILSGSKNVAPKTLTISQVTTALHESTLLKLENVTFTSGSKFSDSPKISDATGEITLYTLSAATFAGKALPSGAVTVVGYLSEFDGTPQLQIRNENDITGGGPCDSSNPNADCDGDGSLNGNDCAPNDAAIYPGAPCNDGDPNTVNDTYNASCTCTGTVAGNGFTETFSSQTDNKAISLSGWENVAPQGTRTWLAKTFDGNIYAQATAFNDASATMETWLITPVINVSQANTLSFESAKAFWVHDGLSVWATTNYTGDPSTTTWQKINAKLAQNADDDHTFIPSGDIDLTPFGTNIRIGFKYEGSKAANTTTFRIDNITVK